MRLLMQKETTVVVKIIVKLKKECSKMKKCFKYSVSCNR